MQFFKLAAQNYFRNFWLTLTSIVIMILMLLSLTLIYIFNVSGQQVLNSFNDKMDLGIYLKQNIDQNKVAFLKTELENIPEIKEVKYLSAEDSLDIFKNKHQNDSLILKSLEELRENPLGAVITLKFHNPGAYQKALDIIEQPIYQELIQNQDFYDYQNLIESFTQISKKITKSGLAISGIFTLITILVIFTTIKLGALSRQKEIKIMRLVGASAWTIRSPFLIEGIYYAFTAWIINGGIILFLSYLFQPQLSIFLESKFNLFQYLTTNSIQFWLILLAFSFFVSLIGSALAIKKYLKI